MLSLSCLLLICLNFSNISCAIDFKLELIQVLFRHGDRVPDKQEVYKTDPYDSIYQQLGYGQLTKIGMQREYQIGQVLREKYDSFLGDFNTADVSASSTNFDRTKMSLQLALAGLYPPTNKTMWNNNILWSPIPTHYKTLDTNYLDWIECKSFIDKVSKDADEKMKSVLDQDFINHIDISTGGFHKSLLMVLLYMNLRSGLSLGLPLPKWCSENDYEKLTKLTAAYFRLLSDTQFKAKVTGGAAVEQFLKNMDNHDNGKGAKKIYLYSAHDAHVASVTNIHNFTGIPEITDYGSTLVIEKLRGSDNQTYIRMFLWTGALEQWIPLEFKNCGYLCPLPIYRKMIEPFLPDKMSRPCVSRVSCRTARKLNTPYDNLDALSKYYFLMAGENVRAFKYANEFYPFA